jgi:branched-chain amino acid transport system substrate-binding protein
MFICLLVGLLVKILWKNNEDEPIIIGFSAQLTGSQAELGVQERNGVQLAVEKINESGGIDERKISLIVNDDRGIAKRAEVGDKELIDKGAVAIIGHATTALALEGLKSTNPSNIVMIGATVSTPELSGIDDYFFRVHPSFKNSAETFAKHIYNSNGITRMAIIYDKDNASYSKTYSKVFSDIFKELGGNITDEIMFSSKAQPDFLPILSELQESKPEGILIIASDVDTALIAQRAKFINSKISLFTSSWAQTETLISNGGKAVEGMEIEEAYNVTNQSEGFIDFRAKYKARFGNEASFGSAYSYEATLILAEALKRTNGSKDGLKQALLETHDFTGLIDKISIDKFGDVERPYYISTINEGKFKMIHEFTSVNAGGN